MRKTLTLVLGVIFLGLILVIPSGISAYFDGLPWVNSTETLTLSVVVPFLVALGWRFLSLRISVFFLGALLLLKIVLAVGSPASGWLIKVHPNLTQEQSADFLLYSKLEGDSWIRTYATLWNEEASGILKKPWTEKLDFPMDWALSVAVPGGNTLSWCCNELNPIIEIEGFLLLPENKKFAVIAKGVQEGTLIVENESGDSFPLSPAKNLKEAVGEFYQLPTAGKWQISGKLFYQGADWSLIPVLIEADGSVTTNLDREILWQSGQVDHIEFYKIISLITDGGIIIFLLVWLVWTIRWLIHKQFLTLPLAVFSMSAVCMPFLMAPIFAKVLSIVGLFDPTTHSYLGISVVVAGLGFLIWILWQKDFRTFQGDKIAPSVFLFFGPPLLCFFTNLWWFHIGKWHLWGVGDDWSSYQYFARKIVVGGEWLNAGGGVFNMQPLYRYFVGIYHLLFGQSAFAQHIADVWCVLGATTLIVSWAMKLRISVFMAFIGSIIYLMITLIGGFRYHIGRGLIENHAMIFMILAAWLLYGAREEKFYKIIGAGICGVIGYWLRQDHLIVVALLVFLIVEPTHGSVREVWQSYWEQIRKYWKRGFTYFGIIFFGFLLICFRNWLVGGVFGPSVPNHVIYQGFDPYSFYLRVKLMLTGNDGTPSFLATSVLLPGVLFGLFSLVWRPNLLKAYPMAFGLAFIGIFLPYVFYGNPGYPPRKSIHLLPLALLSIMIVFDVYFRRFFLKNISDKN
jgi:hypothetical protein